MRIRDWRSDVCSSDLFRHSYPHSWRSKAKIIFRCTPQWFIAMDITSPLPFRGGAGGGGSPDSSAPGAIPHPNPSPQGEGLKNKAATLRDLALNSLRSEEQQSEIQSLIRTSYAVFCLKKKKTNDICAMTLTTITSLCYVTKSTVLST